VELQCIKEADTVFSKRKDVNSGSVAQTENAIQNIILEEMENLDGAFERRFFSKIRFDKPSIEAPTLDSIMKMCNEETISKENVRRIGFC